jgi:hypothetical protein
VWAHGRRAGERSARRPRSAGGIQAARRGVAQHRRRWAAGAVAALAQALGQEQVGARDWQVQEHGRRASATVAAREREQELGGTGRMGVREQSARVTTAAELERTAPA